jgi:hypothetical protein
MSLAQLYFSTKTAAPLDVELQEETDVSSSKSRECQIKVLAMIGYMVIIGFLALFVYLTGVSFLPYGGGIILTF